MSDYVLMKVLHPLKVINADQETLGYSAFPAVQGRTAKISDGKSPIL